MPRQTVPARLTSPCFLFDHGAPPGGGHLLLLQQPFEIVRADAASQVEPALQRLQAAVDEGAYAAGYFSYELGYALHPSLAGLMPPQADGPLLWFGLFDEMALLKGEALRSFFETHAGEDGGLENLTPLWDQDAYLRRYNKAQDYIAAGDIYQLNLTFPLSFDWRGSSLGLYARLRDGQPVAHGGYLDTGDEAILSLSPELFLELKRGVVRTRPMKGTLRRGATDEEDRQLWRMLGEDEKNRAENLMIVDLMRNDFARICDVGSVEVTDLYRVQPLPTLFQMTSGVRGRLRDDVDIAEIARALFPAGSITGAPKLRAMQIISELEAQPRGVYCGAIGLFSRNSSTGDLSARFNVAIRTLTLTPDGRGRAAVGSGLVADSSGPAEYEECRLKYRFLQMPGYRLIETMLLRPDGGYDLLEAHLQRLRASCQALGFMYPGEDIDKGLRRLSRHRPSGYYRVRLVLAAGGRFELTETRIDKPDPEEIVPLALSDNRVDSTDRLLRHKTTRRELYDGEWARWHEQAGAGEVLFLNERGELTEGSRSNLFIGRGELLLTPPLACGLLPGTLRRQLLEEGKAREQVLTMADLQAATEIYVGNSVRGLQRGRLLGEQV